MKKNGFIAEFKEFISRGNVIDMAVGIVIGSSFTAIVNSLVNDIVMPLVGIIIGGIDFSNLKINIGDANISYGLFIQSVINFLVIAFVIFTIVKMLNKFRRKKEDENKEKPVAEDIILLQEIRDLLKDKKND